jgi:thymidine kinase
MDAGSGNRAELVFFTGPMDCGKSTLALQMAHTQSTHDRVGRLYTREDRGGQGAITSRIGLSTSAIEVDDGYDFWRCLTEDLMSGQRVDFIVADEAQFYTAPQIDQLARVVDDLGIDVFCFGILADFRTQLFPASKRLVELADRVETLQVQPLCWCGARGTMNARIINGTMVTQGSQVLVGNTDEPAASVHYEVLCRRHYRLRMPKALGATLSPPLLPLEVDGG